MSWYDWRMAESAVGLIEYVAKLIALRQEHTALRSRHFLHGRREPAPGIFDIAWFKENGELVSEESWKNPEHRLLVLRRATNNADGTVTIMSLLLNPAPEDRYFQLPAPALPARILVDSARPAAPDRDVADNKVDVLARSVVLVFSRIEALSR